MGKRDTFGEYACGMERTIDLSSLNRIELRKWALQGTTLEESNCSLVMKGRERAST